MSDYYIRTPEDNESRGPFDVTKLRTLAEAGQLSENTLYYDEDKEEWIPIALNEALRLEIFPVREKLKLSLKEREASQNTSERDGENTVEVEDLLEAADGNTEQKRHLKKKEKSYQRAAALSSSGLGLMVLFSAVSLIMPHFAMVSQAIEEEAYATVVNYPFLMLGFFDFLMAIFLFLAVTEVYPLLRGRAMLTLGFGVYVGWALGDPLLMIASGGAGAGIFLATISRGLPSMLIALILGLGGNGFLAYLALQDRFKDFFEVVAFELITK
ncbi:DUF4339 domain-containing protein [Coraliomargarita parva]|uniref:DUF4339 domain-containing protein n=1 Tax=Coraliomargarita parva TaxID=3014050 RepID=UPI0022B3837D|nr:GYF domain-containing protein [Coraliomargarita parva]